MVICAWANDRRLGQSVSGTFRKWPQRIFSLSFWAIRIIITRPWGFIICIGISQLSGNYPTYSRKSWFVLIWAWAWNCSSFRRVQSGAESIARILLATILKDCICEVVWTGTRDLLLGRSISRFFGEDETRFSCFDFALNVILAWPQFYAIHFTPASSPKSRLFHHYE